MKTKLGGINVLYPTPTILAGTLVQGKANFNTIAHVGIMNYADPHCISLSMAKMHYTNMGIKENRTFSVNIPSENLVAETDYCGIVSGKKTDKSKVFRTFFGELETAPMIEDCPVNMECRLYDIMDLPTHDVFIGEIVQTYADESVLTEGVVDIAKVRPLLFDMSSKKYWALGGVVANCWNIGKEVKKRLKE